MREIKFRAWDKVKGDMVTDFCLCPTSPGWSAHTIDNNLRGEIKTLYEKKFGDDIIAAYVEPSVIDWSNFYGIENLIPMQFTGLLDKNGREIYEGDLLYSAKIQTDEEPPNDRWIVDVVYEEGSFCYGWHGDALLKGECEKEMEVIGNIYQNPELLTK